MNDSAAATAAARGGEAAAEAATTASAAVSIEQVKNKRITNFTITTRIIEKKTGIY